MRTINVFKYSELSDAAKKKAVEALREQRADRDFDFSEYKASLDAFAEDLEIEITDWGYGLDGCSVDHDDADCLGSRCSGARAYTWIVNNVKGLQPGPRVVTVRRDVVRHGFKQTEYIVKRVSGIYHADDCCLYTGIFCDESLLKPFREFLKAPTDDLTVGDLIAAALESYCAEMLADLEHRESDEYLIEDLENGEELEFFENGTIYG